MEQLQHYKHVVPLIEKILIIFVIPGEFIVKGDLENVENLRDFFQSRGCQVIWAKNDPIDIRRLIEKQYASWKLIGLFMYIKCSGEDTYSYLPTPNLQPGRQGDRMSINEIFSILKSYCKGPKIVLADLLRSENLIFDISNKIAQGNFTDIKSKLEPSLPEDDYHISVCHCTKSSPSFSLLHCLRTAKDQGGFLSLNDLIDRTVELVDNRCPACNVQKLQTQCYFTQNRVPVGPE